MVAAAVPPRESTHRRLLSRAEYDELVERGVLEDAKVELLYGRIVSMPPIGKPHRYSVSNVAELLMGALRPRARVFVQQPFAAPDESEPEPDVTVVAPGDYLDDHPKAAWLIIEVADSSLLRDRAKAKLYAAAGVSDYWIVNLVDDVVEVHREPHAAGYAMVTKHGRGEVVRLVSFPDVDVRVADILPPEGSGGNA
jgi:Uma2 family endonuclease